MVGSGDGAGGRTLVHKRSRLEEERTHLKCKEVVAKKKKKNVHSKVSWRARLDQSTLSTNPWIRHDHLVNPHGTAVVTAVMCRTKRRTVTSNFPGGQWNVQSIPPGIVPVSLQHRTADLRVTKLQCSSACVEFGMRAAVSGTLSSRRSTEHWKTGQEQKKKFLRFVFVQVSRINGWRKRVGGAGINSWLSIVHKHLDSSCPPPHMRH